VLMLFKILLFAALVVLGYLALFQLRQRVIQRVMGLVLAAVLGAFILVPDLSNAASRMLGIGRGADLVFYLSHVLGAYLIIRIFQRQLRLEESLTQLVRALAQAQARTPAVAEAEPSSRLKIFSKEHAGDEADRAQRLERQSRPA
jgi:small membrane protein